MYPLNFYERSLVPLVLTNCTIAVNSVTYALKGADVLGRNKIRKRVVKLRADQTKKGCSYGISVDEKDRDQSLSLLRQSGIPYSEVTCE